MVSSIRRRTMVFQSNDGKCIQRYHLSVPNQWNVVPLFDRNKAANIHILSNSIHINTHPKEVKASSETNGQTEPKSQVLTASSIYYPLTPPKHNFSLSILESSHTSLHSQQKLQQNMHPTRMVASIHRCNSSF